MPDDSRENDDLIGMGGAHGGPFESVPASRPTFHDAANALLAGKIAEPRKGHDEYHPEEPAVRGWDLGV